MCKFFKRGHCTKNTSIYQLHTHVFLKTQVQHNTLNCYANYVIISQILENSVYNDLKDLECNLIAVLWCC